MKYLSIFSILLLSLSSCKKETAVTEINMSADSLSLRDSVVSDSVLVSAKPFVVNPVNEVANLGKTVFMQNGNVLFYFSTVENRGSIKIDGKAFDLDQLNFTDDEYYISGEKIKISAKAGIFDEMTSDCLYGVFSEVNIEHNEKSLTLKNIKVQDCPSY